jgi:hypothetical protein
VAKRIPIPINQIPPVTALAWFGWSRIDAPRLSAREKSLAMSAPTGITSLFDDSRARSKP